MKRKRHSPEQIITKLREADAMLATGATIAQSNYQGTTSGWNDLTAIGNRKGYAGYEWDGVVSLYHVRNRVLHPVLGRWTRRYPPGYSVRGYFGKQKVECGLCWKEGGGLAPTIDCSVGFGGSIRPGPFGKGGKGSKGLMHGDVGGTVCLKCTRRLCPSDGNYYYV
ncbi:MAG: hypothetical protein D8M59_15395 [Planctomycetes bacterium]|nr:hypothetical protein [Planctomycetota bacterium]NOG55352.1 hypothetical protein [Planctomycetota bacterium]